jgi:hypothetical protein
MWLKSGKILDVLDEDLVRFTVADNKKSLYKRSIRVIWYQAARRAEETRPLHESAAKLHYTYAA